ncbi:MAG: hypothetical protein CL402_05595 [Acidiferrobacteraceae bacterium]|nr:hypothetical protein [Acidiferrobacteraceae bacterium]
MMTKKIFFSLLASVFFFISNSAYSHQPILAINDVHSREMPYEIEKPEISKAIYSRLVGEPHIYRIISDKEFDFYAGLTKPKLDSCASVGRTFSLDVLDSNFQILETATGDNFEWWPWFEEFGRKWYWVGPELGQNFRSTKTYPTGTYYIRIQNESNIGNYVLAVGHIESFPIGVMARMLRDLPKINRIFWDNSNCAS